MRLFWSTALLIALAAPVHARSVAIELVAEAPVTGVFYALEEIARVEAEDPELARRVAARRIGRAPRVGQSHGVSRSDVAARVLHAFPELRGRIEWRGSALVQVRGLGQTLLVEDYVAQAQAALEAWLAPRFAQYRLEPVAARAPVSLPLGAVTVRPRLDSKIVPRRRMSVWLDFYVDAVHYRSLPVWFALSASRPGFVARHDLSAGIRPAPDTLRAAMVPVSGRCERLADETLVGGNVRLLAAVQQGRPLCAENLAPRPAVARGEQLVITARSGPIEVQALATALEDGRPGQTIDVRRGARGKRFAVEVTGVNAARVEGDSYE